MEKRVAEIILNERVEAKLECFPLIIQLEGSRAKRLRFSKREGKSLLLTWSSESHSRKGKDNSWKVLVQTIGIVDVFL
jgi:hypothetical protein